LAKTTVPDIFDQASPDIFDQASDDGWKRAMIPLDAQRSSRENAPCR
jgi:hypothetical protein